MYKVDNYNRNLILERYVDNIVHNLHLLEAREMLKSLLLKEKSQLDDEELEIEIMRHDPGLFTDIYVEELMEEINSI